MRCEDLTREIATPTGTWNPSEIAGHLAACSDCAERSRRATRLDRIWEATRPSEPSMDALDALWARAAHELDSRKVPTIRKFARPAHHRRWAVAGFVAAQAAAVLVVAFLMHKHSPTAVAEPVVLNFGVGDDQLAVVRIDSKGQAPKVEMLDLSRLYASPSLPAYTPHDEVDEIESSGLEVVSIQ